MHDIKCLSQSSDTRHRGDKCVSAVTKLHLYCATVASLYFCDRTFSYLSKQDLKKLSWLLMNSFWEYVKRLRTDHLWLLRSNLLGNVLEAKPTRWKRFNVGIPERRKKKQRDVIRETMEYQVFRRCCSEGMAGPELLTTSSSNATIPRRHAVALTLIGLNAPEGTHTGITVICLVSSGIKQIIL